MEFMGAWPPDEELMDIGTEQILWQYVVLAITVIVPLGILALVIVIAYPALERWRFSKIENRMMEQKMIRRRG